MGGAPVLLRCGHYLLCYDEWRECYNEVYKIYRRDGEGVVRVGGYVAP